MGAGGMVGALAAPAAMARWRAGVLILLGVIGTGIAGALTGFSQNIPAAAVFLFISGATNTLYYVSMISVTQRRSEEHTSELQSQSNLVCRLLLEKKNNQFGTSLPPMLRRYTHSRLTYLVHGAACSRFRRIASRLAL